jgi:hypothetical protein
MLNLSAFLQGGVKLMKCIKGVAQFKILPTSALTTKLLWLTDKIISQYDNNHNLKTGVEKTTETFLHAQRITGFLDFFPSSGILEKIDDSDWD